MQPLFLRSGWLAVAAVAVLAQPAHAQSDAASDVVGEVTTVIGVADVKRRSGEGESVRRGSTIRSGDRVETGSGAHVHIRFIDGGMVSVRPLSRLRIEEYSNHLANARGAIKFQLEQGVVRSVTGEWGEAARDRFRLNTPVAAIGIKGTDFIVRADMATTQAAVVSGAIVMSPLEGSCVGTVGPCNLDRSAMLTADMHGKMLEFVQNGGQVPRLVPMLDLEARLGSDPVASRTTDRNAPHAPASATPPAPAAEKLVIAESVQKPVINQSLAGTLVEDKVLESDLATGKTPVPAPVPVPSVPVPSVPSVPSVPPVPNDARLVWVRNAVNWNIPPNSISERLDAAEMAGRKAVVGNFFITLYRDQTTRATFSPEVASASFALSQASASYSRPGVAYQPVAVSNGRLDVDFARSSYATSLDLNGAFGQTTLQSSGRITSTGTFQEASAGQAVAGAFSYDGKQAGYQFDKAVAHGSVSGITLWKR